MTVNNDRKEDIITDLSNGIRIRGLMSAIKACFCTL